MNRPMYLGLIHHPIKDKRGDLITTSVTNMDIHDIARTARTFGFKGYFIVTPIEKQHKLVSTILDYWNTDSANEYNPDRSSALSFIKLENTVENAIDKIKEAEGESPLVCVTGANFEESDGNEAALRSKLELDNKPLFLLFGTGWGLHASLLEKADFMLNPIHGTAYDGYNHLSVRSAVAIYCDRIGSIASES